MGGATKLGAIPLRQSSNMVILDPMNDEELKALALLVSQRLIESKNSLATAESCTGGWLAKLLTDIAGSSEWFERGFVTYSNQAKQEMLGVSEVVLNKEGAVSSATVSEMVAGALEYSHASFAVAVSGIAGPGGGSDEKPLGTVWLAWMHRGETPIIEQRLFAGDRDAVRRQSVARLLSGICENIGSS